MPRKKESESQVIEERPQTENKFEGINSCFVCGRDNPKILRPNGKFCSEECLGRYLNN